MSLFADGGFFASKPYCSGAGYIKKMSNYCKNCAYTPDKKLGANACPFNYLYWDFLDRNRNLLVKNPRMGMMYKTYDRMNDEKKHAIKKEAGEFLTTLK